MTPDDPEESGTAIRYVPQPVRSRLVEMLGAHDVRLVASGHVHQRRDFTLWPHPPCLGAVRRLHHSRPNAARDRRQGMSGWWSIVSSPTAFEVRHVRAPGQIDVGLDSLIGRK